MLYRFLHFITHYGTLLYHDKIAVASETFFQYLLFCNGCFFAFLLYCLECKYFPSRLLLLNYRT